MNLLLLLLLLALMLSLNQCVCFYLVFVAFIDYFYRFNCCFVDCVVELLVTWIRENLLNGSSFTVFIMLGCTNDSLKFFIGIIVQGLTWLLPERFSESEIGPEAGFVKLW